MKCDQRAPHNGLVELDFLAAKLAMNSALHSLLYACAAAASASRQPAGAGLAVMRTFQHRRRA